MISTAVPNRPAVHAKVGLRVGDAEPANVEVLEPRGE
jgi:hypothetical protein